MAEDAGASRPDVRSSFEEQNRRPPLYGLDSNQSGSSIFEDVEMAHEELYSGPVAESLPTSVSTFSHRRARADSTTSFTYYEEEPGTPTDEEESLSRSYNRSSIAGGDYLRGSLSDVGELDIGEFEEDEDSADRDYPGSPDDFVLHRRSSTLSRNSIHAHLLRHDSALTAASAGLTGRTTQKLYMVNEDLTIAIAGFRTTWSGYLIYVLLCVCSAGVGYLLFRWLPRSYVAVMGKPSPLRDCDWVVIENQWGQMAIIDVKVQNYGRPVSSVFGIPEKVSQYVLDEENDPLISQLRSLDYRYVRMCFHPLRDKFVIASGWKDPEWTDVQKARLGLDSDEKSIRDILFGNNMIDIEMKSVAQLLVDEVLHPFYIFQIASLILWSLDTYYYYAACIFLISAGSIITTLIETRATMRRLREISRFECDVRILRNGFWRYVNSAELVPGDVYELSDPNLTQVPSDSVLLTGDCIVNESMLTGESVPVSKISATDEIFQSMDLAASSVSPETARHFLFCGTKIIRARRPQEDLSGDAAALALVVRTGFNTTKGALVRSMLFPKPSGFKFYRDSFRYISVMGLIAILGFIASFINFIRLNVAWHMIVVRALDLITIVVPPALPATLTIGTNFALNRLKTKQIFCISPQRVNVGGKLDIMCFDKTGTLTEDGLDVLGVRVIESDSKKFGDVLSESEILSREAAASDLRSSLRAALYTMATCHSLRSVDDELVGDPLDLKMFEFTRWSFQEGKQSSGEAEIEEQSSLTPSVARPPDGSIELGILKSFEFVSHLRRASVIVRQFGSQRGDIFLKGAPEAIRDICRPCSIPSDYENLLSHYTHQGYRVIGIATRHLPKLSWVKAQKMTRGDVETDLDFVGFIIFENKLKPTTSAVLAELLESNISSVMVTGDNILTAISVARKCGLIDSSAHCYVPRFIQGDCRDPTAQLQWENIDDNLYCLDKASLLPLPVPPEADASLPYDISNIRNYSVAVSGEVFRWIVDYASPEILHRVLVKGKVFARMSPDEKHELIEKLQSIDFSCGFCGDGANDCGALKAADVGISLSEAEASVAAPFTSRKFDICCVLEVIKEGRAALVTSFSCFKYMSLYSAIQFTSVSFLYAKASNLGDFQFLFIDLLLILPIAVFMGWAGPAPSLCRKRPTADLVSRKVLTPLLGLMLICVAMQTVAYLTVRGQPWYKPPKLDHEISNIESSENTALFVTSCFEYIFSGLILNAGRPFRQRAAENWPFSLTVLVALLATGWMALAPARWLSKLMQLSKMSWNYEMFLVAVGATYLAIGWAFERYAALALAQRIGRWNEIMGRRKKRKEYKIIQEGMRI